MQWAREIAAAKPELGLQKAAEWRTQFPSDFSPTPDATTVAADSVNLLVGDLAALGVHYTVAAADTGYDVEAPALFPFGFMDVRVTQHDVILARQESRLKVSNPQAGQYQARITRRADPPPLGLGVGRCERRQPHVPLRHRPSRLDLRAGAGRAGARVPRLGGPGSTTLPLVWAGDFNSDADATTVTGIVPDTATYQNIVGAGLRDTWAAVNPGDPGYTCCEAANLETRNPRSTSESTTSSRAAPGRQLTQPLSAPAPPTRPRATAGPPTTPASRETQPARTVVEEPQRPGTPFAGAGPLGPSTHHDAVGESCSAHLGR